MFPQTTTTTANLARHTVRHPPVFSKIDRVPDLLRDGDRTVSLYADASGVLHMQCHLCKSGLLVLFPVTFRLVNRYLAGDYDLAELIARAPCEELLLVTRRHNLVELDKATVDTWQICFARSRYTSISHGKVATSREIRDKLNACMRL